MLRAFCDEGVSLLIHIERFNLALLFVDICAFIKRMTYKPSSKYTVGTSSMPIQKGVQTAPTLAIFSVDDPNTISSGPSSPVSKTPFNWR